MTWSNVAAGTYSMTAVARDNTGATATSLAVIITVTAPPPPNVAPSVALTGPAAGATFTAPAAVTLTASATDSDGSIVSVDFFAGVTKLGSATTAPYSFVWSNVAAGTYSLAAVARDNAGATRTSTAVSITVTAPPPPPPPPPATGLPTGWTNADIGLVGAAGNSKFDQAAGAFTVTGAGADVWGTADAFQFAWRSWSGDGTIQARVTSVANVSTWVKAGVMIRASTAPGSAHAFMIVSSGKGLAFQRRRASGGSSLNTFGGAGSAPYWVRLHRAGNVITASASKDGVAWTVIGSDTIPMGQTVLVGLAVSSHITGRTAAARFDNVTVRAPAPPPGVALPERFTASAKILQTSLSTTIDITRWSSDAEQDGLLAILREHGQDAMLTALRKLAPPASVTSVGSKHDFHFASVEMEANGGRSIFLLTGRSISDWEEANRPSLTDYPFTVIQLQVNKDGKGVGTAALATKIRVAADGTIQLETYSDYSVPLVNVTKVK
jgi:hypothetical protein